MSERVKTIRVLVVEDEPLIGMDIESAVQRLGHEVVGPVGEIGKALSLAADETIACAILDINIRGGNTYPIADMLLKRGVPLLLLSGYSSHSLPESLQQEARLAKPFIGEQLDEEIRILCTRILHSGQSERLDKS